jgi:hypothetical protein
VTDVEGPMENEMVAWAAGVFEGEGTIYVRSAWVYGVFVRDAYASLSMSMTDLDVMEKFRVVVGGGALFPLKKKAKEHHKQQWRWTIGRLPEVQRVLQLFRPYLGSRRGAKADRALALVVGSHIKRTDRLCGGGHPLFGPESDTYVKANGWLECRVCRRGYDLRRHLKRKGREAEGGTIVPIKRLVHAEHGDLRVAHYGLKGTWQIENDPLLLRPVRRVTPKEAAEVALVMLNGGGVVHFGLPGGGTFEKAIRSLQAAEGKVSA